MNGRWDKKGYYKVEYVKVGQCHKLMGRRPVTDGGDGL